MRYSLYLLCAASLLALAVGGSAPPLLGCGGDEACTPAEEGCVCNGGQCLSGLQCLSNLCVDPGGTGGTGGTGGMAGTGGIGGEGGGGPVCGDSVAQPPEVCDGTDLAGEDCVSQGFTGGTLGCQAGCTGFDTSGCTGVPPGWTCLPEWYGADDGCDCGCGVIDLDCADGTVASCEFSNCPGEINPTQNWLCDGGGPVCGDDTIQAPEVCDGTDLGDFTGATCEEAGFTGGTLACNATCDNLDLTGCTGGPAGWTCPAEYYGADDGCDCGCGVIDPDCADGTVASCEFCSQASSCSPLGSDCPGDINPTQNWLCVE
jgi:hypothetical protein